MHGDLGTALLRPWRQSDIDSLAHHANNPKVWINLRDAFPHPYTRDDAAAFIDRCTREEPCTHAAIDVGGEAVGSIGFSLQPDVERVSSEIGYFLGEAHWGRGIMTAAVRVVTRYVIDTHGVTRVYALPFEWNHRSMRVLEKAGFVLEARLRRSAIKDGRIIDQFQYAFVST